MIYCRTINVERIAVHPNEDEFHTKFIEITRYGDEPVFSVRIDNKDEEWYWEFDCTCPSDYERVKFSIFDAIYECDDTYELACYLAEVFENGFEDILIFCKYEDMCEGCDGCKYLQ